MAMWLGAALAGAPAGAGCGLDYGQRYRNIPYIGVLRPEVYEK